MLGEPTITARRTLVRALALLAAVALWGCGGGGVVVAPPPPVPPQPSLLVVLPGQSFEASVGVTGTPDAQVANTLFAIELIAVDEDIVPYTNFAGTVGVFSSDSATPAPPATSFPTGEGVEARVSLNIRPVTAGSGNTLTPVHIADEPLVAVVSDAYSVSPSAATQLVTLLPGQSVVPALPLPVRSPAAAAQQVGTSYQVRVVATDTVGNIVTSAAGNVTILTSDPRDVEPGAAPLSSGQVSFTINPVFAQPNAFVRASTVGLNVGFSDDHVVLSQPAQDLYVLLPTQSLRVDATGAQVIGLPPAQTTGTPFQVRVVAADSFGNVDATVSGNVTLTTPTDAADDGAGGDPYALSMTSGEATYLLSLVSATSPGNPAQLSASGLSLTPGDSSFFDVEFSGAARVVVLLPGQSIMPDLSGPIVMGTPMTQTSGAAFNIEAHAVDAFGNLDTSYSANVTITTNDGFDTDPGTVSFVGGIAMVSVTNVIATSSATITAQAGFDDDTSDPYDVLAGDVNTMAVLLPGQSYEPSLAGPVVVGTPPQQTAGSSFQFQVALTDAYGNAVTNQQRTVVVSTASSVDSADTNPPPTLSVSGVATITHTPIRARTDYRYQVTTQGPSPPPLPQVLSSNFIVNAVATRLAVLLPDQSIAIQNDGDGFAITGSPAMTPQTGVAFSATVSAVDFFGNVDTSATPSVTVTTSDNLDTNPGAGALVAGTRTFMVTPVLAGSGQTVSATSNGLAMGTSTSYSVGTTATALLAIDPFTQTLNPSAGGPQVSGAPRSQIAGSSFQVVALAIDQYGNIDTTETRQVTLSTTLDAADTEPAPANLATGSRAFTITALTARSGYTFTVSDSSGMMDALSADTSDGFTVSPASVAYLVVTLPGQTITIAPSSGMAPAVSGAAPTFTAGQMPAPLIGVTSTDVYGNRNFGFNGVVRLSSNDPATSPIDNVLQTGVNGGFREFPFTPYTDSDSLPGSAMTLSAQDLGATLPTYTTAGITVNGQSATQLFVRFPGETITARSTGPVVLNAGDAQEIGVGFQAEVVALDDFGNLDAGASLTDVEISTDDPGDAGPFNAALASGIATFTLTPSVEGPISVSIDAHTPMSLTMAGARSYRAYPLVLGQAGGGTNAAATTSTGLQLPTSVAIDSASTTRRAYVADTDNHRILGWSSADALANGQAASLVIGQSDLASGGCNRGNAPGAADSNRLCEPRGLAVDSQGRLWVADTLNNRVLRFNDPFGTDLIADLVLGQANFTAGSANRGGSVASNTLSGPTDVEVDSSGNVWVADTGNNRVLRFDAPGDTTADLVVGQTNFTSGSCNAGSTPTAGRLCGPMGLALSGTTLWVADTLNNRVLRFPTPANNTATLALGQGSLTSSDCNGAGMSVAGNTLCLPEDVTPGAGTDLYVSDSANNRVLYYNNPTVSGFPASSALGQPDLTSGGANNPALDITTLSGPADLAWWAGALFIADGANNRVVGRIP